MRPIYTGSFFGLLNPFGLLCGVVSLLMIVAHGANYLVLRTEDDLQRRASVVSTLTSFATVVLFILGGIWAYFGVDGFIATAGLDPAGPANPLAKTVDVYAGAWFANFSSYPVLWLVPLVAVLGFVVSGILARGMKGLAAVVSSAVGLTIWDCTSSQLTLEIMLVVTLIFLPIVVAYTTWAYRTMSGKITSDFIAKNDHNLY